MEGSPQHKEGHGARIDQALCLHAAGGRGGVEAGCNSSEALRGVHGGDALVEGSSSLPGACVTVGGGADRGIRKVDGRRRKLPNEVVFATANITSADPAGRLGARAVGTNCTGRMAELELLFDKAGFDVISVQEGRMPHCTVLQGDVFTMYVDKGRCYSFPWQPNLGQKVSLWRRRIGEERQQPHHVC